LVYLLALVFHLNFYRMQSGEYLSFYLLNICTTFRFHTLYQTETRRYLSKTFSKSYCGQYFLWSYRESCGKKDSAHTTHMATKLRTKLKDVSFSFALHSKVYWSYLKIMIQKSMEYRTNFFIQLFVEIGHIVLTIVFFYVIFGNVSDIAGWSKDKMWVLIGIFTVFSELIVGLFYVWNLSSLPSKIKDGYIDFTLLKPANSQFLLTASSTYISSFVSTIPGFIMIFIGLTNLNLTVTLAQLLVSIILFICGIIVFYSVMTMLTSLAFLFTNSSASLARLVIDLYQFGQYPPTMYKGLVKVFFLIVLPVTIAAGFPADTLLHGISIGNVLLSIVVAAGFLYASTRVWKQMIKHYSSASS